MSGWTFQETRLRLLEIKQNLVQTNETSFQLGSSFTYFKFFAISSFKMIPAGF